VSTPEPVPFERSGDEQDAAAFAAAAEKLLNVVDGTLAEMRQGREETRVLLDRLEVRLGSLHG
jgi:hypothetical protein